MNADLAAAEESLRNFRDLEKNPAFGKLMQEIQRMHDRHDAGCKDKNLTADKRAEHIEAVHSFKDLLGYAQRQREALEKKTASLRKN